MFKSNKYPVPRKHLSDLVCRIFGGEAERSLGHDRALFTRSSYHATRHAC